MNLWRKRKAGNPLLLVHGWKVVLDSIGLAGDGWAGEDVESQAKSLGEGILRLRLGEASEFPVVDLGYYGWPRRFVVIFLVDDDMEDEKAASYYNTIAEALHAVQRSIDATEGWSHW